MLLWFTSLSKALWRSSDQRSFSSGVSHSGPSVSLNISCGYSPFPECIIEIGIFSNIGFLTCGMVVITA